MLVTHFHPWSARANVGSRHTHSTATPAATADGQAWTPRVDVREEDERFVILADLPGIDPADIEIQMEKGTLSLKGERKTAATTDGATATHSERMHGRFDRRFAMPDSADAEGIRATGRHGVLEISIPKKPATKPRRIAINT